MKRLSKIVACLGMIVGVGALGAMALQPATTAPTKGMPAIYISEVETNSPEDYAVWVAQGNKAIYDKIHVENYTKVFVGQAAGEDSGKVYAVQTADSFAKLQDNGALFESDPAIQKIQTQMAQVRKLGNRTALKAVRFEGRNATSFNFNTKAVLSDEGAYLKALDGLRSLYDAHGLKDVKINCYRVSAGKSDYTHLISLNCPTAESRAAMMDAMSEPWGQEWIASVGKIRTVVRNGMYKEVTR
jgi:hypothetical protein